MSGIRRRRSVLRAAFPLFDDEGRIVPAVAMQPFSRPRTSPCPKAGASVRPALDPRGGKP